MVRISGPFAVTTIVCSKCAASDPSRVMTVHWSARVWVASEPSVSIGSIARQIPGTSSIPLDLERKFGTWGSSCMAVPMPWPTYCRMIPYPPAVAMSSTAAEISPIRLPGTAAAMPAINARRVVRTSPRAAGVAADSPPQMNDRAPSPCQPS